MTAATQAAASRTPDVMAQVAELLGDQVAAVDTCIRENLASDVALIDQVSDYIIAAGGKRLRPVSLLLAAGACGYDGPDAVPLAAIVEFIHTATLLHDDVVDESEQRRGRDTANEVWGNAASVLVGDFLYSRAFQMMVRVNRMPVMGILADATNTIAEGEVMQLLNAGNPDTTEEAYLRTIRCKTAALFAAATEIGGVLGGLKDAPRARMASYGEHLGIAFQIADDILDFTAAPEQLGKNLGDDLAEGKPTLPLIYALNQADSVRRKTLRTAIREGDRAAFPAVLEVIQSTGAVAYASQAAERAVSAACESLSDLPDTAYRDCLYDLASFALRREQ